MAEETTQSPSIGDVLDQVFNQNKSLEDINSDAKVVNNDNQDNPPSDNPTDTPPADNPPSDNPTDPPADEPWFKKRGFGSEAEADSYLESTKKPIPPSYKNPLAKELDAFTSATGKDNFDEFLFYKNTEIKENPTIEDRLSLIIQKDIMETPVLAKFEKAELMEEYKKRYMLDMDPEHAPLGEKIDAAKKEAELIEKSNGIIKDIQDMKSKITNGGVSETEIAEFQKTQDERKTKWAEVATKEANDFKLEIKDFKTNDKGEDEFLEDTIKDFIFDKQQEVKDTYKTVFDAIIADKQYPDLNSDSAKKEARFLAEAAVTRLYLHRIVKEAMAQTEARMIREHNLEVDNPSSKKKVELKANPEGAISEAQAVKEALG